MVVRKVSAARTNGVVEPPAEAIPLSSKATSLESQPLSRIPTPVQLLLVTIISFSTSFVLFSVGGVLTRDELGTVSRQPRELSDFLLFPALRVVELSVGWWAGFDDYDMASFALQTRLPYYFLLTTFYSISLPTCAWSLLFEVAAAFTPFYLLRTRIPAHDTHAPRGSVANPGIIRSATTNLLVTTFAATVYSVIMYISYNSWLLTYLVTNFDGVRTLDVAHNSQIPVLVLTFFPLGWTAKVLLFAPATAATTNLSDARYRGKFNPETATLSEHVRHNVWGWDKGTKVLVKRALVLAVGVFAATAVKTWKTLDGSEFAGSVGWAGLWAGAAVVNAGLMRWVGDV